MHYKDYKIVYSEGNNLLEVTKLLSKKVSEALSSGWSLYGDLIIKHYLPLPPQDMEINSNKRYVLFQTIVK